MSTAIPDRAGQRKRLKALMEETGEFQKVWRALAKNFEQKSPICCVYSDGSGPTLREVSKGTGLRILIAVRRDKDAELAEDKIDQLGKAVRKKLIAHHDEPPFWQELEFDEEPSIMDYYPSGETDGIQYRYEMIFIDTISIC